MPSRTSLRLLARWRAQLACERGIALVLAIGMLSALAISVSSALYFTSTNSRSAEISESRQVARALAEAGLNNALAVLFDDGNDALDPTILPDSEAASITGDYVGGTAKWWGVLSGNTWTLHGVGVVRNPTSGSDIRRELTAQSTVGSSLIGTLNNQAWNYIFATRTGNTCDQELTNSAIVDNPMYVSGNLCLDNSAMITEGPLVVQGQLTLKSNSNRVGSEDAKINEAHIAAGCQVKDNPLHNPCLYGEEPEGDNVWAGTLDAGPTTITPPTAEFQTWYDDPNTINSSDDCTTISGTPPTFDDNTSRDSSVKPEQHLTPEGSYTCRKESGGSVLAELSWDDSTKTLTVQGTVFIDGDAKIENDSNNRYDGQGSVYLSGTFLMGNSTKLCAVEEGGNCTWTGWDPNSELLIFVVDGSGGQAGDGNGVSLTNSTHLQAGIFATAAIDLQNSVKVEGPMVASHVNITNSVETYTFPLITDVPAGTPGQPNVHAQPSSPTNYSG